MINKVRGTQDILDMRLFDFLIKKISGYLNIYNFSHINTPILEHTELFKRSLGLQTDVVTKEMYIFNNTNTEEESICLRPELTASTLRAFLNAGIQAVPWKAFTYGPLFRHERPQKGRLREFNQINAEVIGSDSIYQDAQFIKMFERLFQEEFNLDEYALIINFLGCKNDRNSFKFILNNFLDTVLYKICNNCKERKDKNIMRVFDCKNEACQETYMSAPHLTDHMCSECNIEWTTLKNELEHLAVTYSHVPTLVRGLDYYDKTVFEFVSMNLGAQSSFCAGGRYNSLANDLGSKQNYSCIGAALGLERFTLMLEAEKIDLSKIEEQILHVVLPIAKEQISLALLFADELQAKKLKTEVLLEGDSVKSMFRTANRLNARYCLIIGDTEQKDGCVIIKDMQNSTEQRVKLTEAINILTKYI